MKKQDLNKMLEFVRTLDIATNPEPAAIFDPLIQGFNIWCIPSDHPGGDWEQVINIMNAGAYTKRCEYVGCAFYYNDGNGVIQLTTDAYALQENLRGEYRKPGAIRNRKDDIAWARKKVEWVFEQIGVECPQIVIGEDR